MLKCGNCDIEYSNTDKMQKCLACNSDLYQSIDANTSRGIDIGLGFMAILCTQCNITYDCSVDKCESCGYVFGLVVDELVENRKEKLAPIFELITKLEDDFKAVNQDIKSGCIEKTSVGLDFINCFYEDFTSAVNEASRLFGNMNLSNDAINGKEATEITDEIYNLFQSLFELRKKLLLSEPEVLYVNTFERLSDTFIKYLSSMKLINECMISNTLAEARSLMNKAQIKRDEACSSLKVIKKINSINNILHKINLSEDSAIDFDILMMCTLYVETESIESSASLTERKAKELYEYFSHALSEGKEYYDNNGLLSLAHFMMFSLFASNEKRFLSKAHKVSKLLSDAFSLDKKTFLNFIDKFTDKYHHAWDHLISASKQDMLFLSRANNDYEIYIDGSVGTYKRLCEGVYRDLTSIIILSVKILNKSKDIDLDKIIDMNFAEKSEFINAQSKLKLSNLSEGITKVIRHAEAHVDYTIDDNSKSISFRNENPDSGKVNVLHLSYDEFECEKTLLHETLNAILCGIGIFVLNNKYDFHDKFKPKPQNIGKVEKVINVGTILFAELGIIKVTSNIVFDSSLNIEKLQIKAISVLNTDSSILEKCFDCCAYYTYCQNNEIPYVELELFDCEKKLIGTLSYHHEYICNWFDNKDNHLQQYNLLIYSLTRNISYCYNDGIVDSLNENDADGIIFVKRILTEYIAPMLKALLDRNQNPNKNEIKFELGYVIDISNKYTKHVNRIYGIRGLKCLILNLINIIESFEKNEVISDAKIRGLGLFYSDVLGTIASDGRDKLFDVFNGYSLNYSVGRNDLCPCVSGRKYKSCCLSYIAP